jgi:hypothetical protein
LADPLNDMDATHPRPDPTHSPPRVALRDRSLHRFDPG